MRIAVFLCAVLATALAVPNGYYHQEYRSQSSSSAYKNDELQHKTDDESFYSKHGDVEGRSEPKVNSYSQHLEYQNPNRGHGARDHFGSSDLSQRAEDGFSQLGSGSSFGESSMRQMQGNSHNSRRYYGSDSSAQRGSSMRQTQLNPTDDLHGNRKHYSYSGSYSINSGLTPISGGRYDTPSYLQTITQQLQDDMSTQLQSAIARQHQSSSYSQTSSTVESDMRELERELKTNLTRQLQEKLTNQYGIQGKRGAYSYSITSGNFNPQANYNNQELDDLTAEIQRNLMQQLETGVRNEHSERSSSSSSHRYQSNYGAMHRPRTPTYVTNVEAIPVVNPSVPLLDVTTGVQNDLDREVNTALHSLEQKYLIEEFSERPDHEAILQDLQNQLKRNLTIILDEALIRTYGRQEQRGSYFFNAGSSTANYKVEDLDNLKQQIESNLVKKIKQVLNEQTTRYSTRRQQHESHSRPAYRPSGHRTETVNTHDTHDNRQYQSSHYDQTPYNPRPTNRDEPVYTSYATYRPHKSNERVESNSQVETTYEGNRRYGDVRHTYRPNYETTSEVDDLRTDYNNRRPAAPNDDFQYSYNPTDSQRPYGAGPNTQTSQRRDSSHSYTSGVEITPNSQVELVNIRQELQNDLSQQIQDVINKQRQQSNSYSSSTSFVPANNQIVTELSEELKRNLTQKLEEVLRQHYGRQGMKSGYAFTITTSGAYNPKANYNVDQITDLTNQVQEDLLRQLREGLTKQSYQSSQSSSSSTIYKPMITYGTYGAGSNRYVTGSSQYGTAYGQMGYGQTSSSNTELDSDCVQNDDNFTNHHHDRLNETIQPIRGDQAPKAQSEETHVDLEVTSSEGLEAARPKQHPGQAAQTLIDSERAEDLTQQIEDIDLNQHVQEPSLGVHPAQHEVNEQLTFGDHDLLLTQQTEDQDQSQLHFGTFETNQDASRKPQPGSLNVELSQKQDQFDEHHLQLHQQTEVQQSQHADLSQQTIDDFDQIDNSKTNQQLEGFSQQQQEFEFSQQLEDQHSSNFNQQLVDTSHDDTIGKLQTGQQFEQFPQQHEDDFTQQLEQQQQLEQLEQQQQLDSGLSQQTVNGFDGFAHGLHTQSSYSQQASSAYSSSHNKTYSSSLTVPSQVVYATVHQTPVETTHDLEQQVVDEEFAHVVQDVSHQAQTHSVHATSGVSSDSKVNFAQIEEIETTTAVAEKPGFWKRLGGKITNTYKKAKDKISEQLG